MSDPATVNRPEDLVSYWSAHRPDGHPVIVADLLTRNVRLLSAPDERVVATWSSPPPASLLVLQSMAAALWPRNQWVDQVALIAPSYAYRALRSAVEADLGVEALVERDQAVLRFSRPPKAPHRPEVPLPEASWGEVLASVTFDLDVRHSDPGDVIRVTVRPIPMIYGSRLIRIHTKLDVEDNLAGRVEALDARRIGAEVVHLPLDRERHADAVREALKAMGPVH